MYRNITPRALAASLLVGCLSWSLFAVAAEPTIEVRIAKDLPYADVQHQGKTLRIQRNQDQENMLTGGFAKTSRKCPPFCIHPMEVAPGVVTVGEIELVDFLRIRVHGGTGIVIDARTPSLFEKGTIPGSINIPFTAFELDPQSEDFRAVMAQLGVQPATGEASAWDTLVRKTTAVFGDAEEVSPWDFSRAQELVLWCNGPWCDQSPRAIRALLQNGYPPEKIRYYRGGMQLWQALGFNAVIPDI